MSRKTPGVMRVLMKQGKQCNGRNNGGWSKQVWMKFEGSQGRGILGVEERGKKMEWRLKRSG